MRIAVFSDIHGNFEAFKAVLAHIERVGAERLVCVGDMVGYGPEPEEAVDLIRCREIPVVLGNHDRAIFDAAYLRRLNEISRKSLHITKELVSAETIQFCKNLPVTLELADALFVHGSPPDSVTRYLFTPSAELLGKLFQSFARQVCFVGHTHSLTLFVSDGAKTKTKTLEQGIYPLEADKRYIVNVGSVGQPRDGTAEAKCVIWDQEKAQIEVCYVSYDIKATADKILALGFPESNATRLWCR